MSGRALAVAVALGGCLSAPPSSVGDGGTPSDDGGAAELAPCDVPEDCPDGGRARVCHCGSCAVNDLDCAPSALRWVREDGKDGDCAPAATALALGYQSTCVRWSDGRASCWGDDCFGEVGDGGDDSCGDNAHYSLTPRLVRESTGGPPFGGVLALSAGFHHVCALRSDSTVWCWGSNDHGKLGDGSSVSQISTPVQVVTDLGPLTGIVAIAAGNDHTCALTDGGDVFCWGGNNYLQLGVSGIAERGIAAQAGIGTGFTQIASGGWHSCVARPEAPGNLLYCWGRAGFGQLGYGGTQEPGSEDAQLVVYEPNGVGLVTTAIGLGENFSCSGADGPAAWCWGSNMSHTLGDEVEPTTADGMDALSAREVMLTLPTAPSHIAAGTSFACMRLLDGSLTCWGANDVGQLGIGQMGPLPLGPTEVPLDTEQIVAGDDHVCALTAASTVLCWGGNEQGQLGNGNTEPNGDPGEVMDLCQ